MITFEELCNKLVSGERFALSRWNDGEQNCIDGKGTHNCDGHKYFDDLGKALKDITQKPQRYYMAAGIFWDKSKYPNIKWSNGRIFVDEYVANEITKLFEILKNIPCAIVGNSQFRDFDEFAFEHILISDKNCWLDYKNIRDNILNSSHEVILCCAGMMTKVLVDELWDKKTIIDMGSVLDPYCGNITRSYQIAYTITK